MKFARGNIWTYKADWRVVFTNGFIKKNGECVMGRGTAWQAKKRFPELPTRLGLFLKDHGNHVGIFEDIKLLTMPTKHRWFDKEADIVLIERSCLELSSLPYKETFVMGLPGCGCGQLDWGEVKLIVEPILDDRFIILEQ